MSALPPDDRPPAPAPVSNGPDPPRPGGPALPDTSPPKHRNTWKWVSAALVVVAAGLLVWALSTRSDLDQAQDDVAQLESQADAAKDTGGDAVAAAQDAYADITQQLGTTNDDLAEVEQELEQAQQDAAKAQDEADKAQDEANKATNQTDKAQADADAAHARADAADAKAAVAADCANAYASALGALTGDGADLDAVKAQLQQITSGCKTALADADAGA